MTEAGIFPNQPRTLCLGTPVKAAVEASALKVNASELLPF